MAKGRIAKSNLITSKSSLHTGLGVLAAKLREICGRSLYDPSRFDKELTDGDLVIISIREKSVRFEARITY